MRRIVARIQSFLNAVFRRNAMGGAMDDEFAHHIELRTRDLINRGLTAAAASQKARAEFGSVTTTKEMARESRGVAWFDSMGQDLRYAARTMRKNKGFTAVAVLSLGFGIGATTTMFSIVNALDLRALPYAASERLVWINEITPKTFAGAANVAWATSRATASDWMTQAHSFESVAAFDQSTFSWEQGDVVESLRAAAVTPNFLPTLGVQPMLGRAFNEADADPGGAPVVMVSYEFWQSRLNGAASAIGSQLPTRSATANPPTIIGVLPREFNFWTNAPVWRPLRVASTDSRTNRELTVIARLKPEASVAMANAEIRTITSRLSNAFPEAYRDWGGGSVQALRSLFVGASVKEHYVLFAVTALVLGIAILNVAALLLGRAITRQSEFAMRSALGASRARLVRQLLIEGATTGIAGGAGGILLAYWAIKFVPHWFNFDRSGLPIVIDVRVLAFGLLVSLAVGLAAAAIPAFRSVQFAPAQAFRKSGMATKQSARISSVLISAQISFALVLLTAASLLGREFVNLRYLDLGYDPTALYLSYLSGTPQQAKDLAAWKIATESARERVGTLPGVTAVATEHQNAMHPQIVRLDGERDVNDPNAPGVKAVSRDYFTTFGMRIAIGREFDVDDRVGSEQVAIINRAAAQKYWPGTSAIGHSILVGDRATPLVMLRIVGVVGDAERGERGERHWPVFYRPIAQAPMYHAGGAMYVRVPSGSPAVFAAVANAIHEATGQKVAPLKSENENISSRLLSQQARAVALNVFALFGLLLASMGLYGSTAYAAAQRTREIGIRMALGAERHGIMSVLARRSVWVAAIGIAAGVGGALASTRLLRAFVVGTSVTDPWMFGASTVLMIVVALVATFIPVRRATNVDPTIALRAE